MYIIMLLCHNYVHTWICIGDKVISDSKFTVLHVAIASPNFAKTIFVNLLADFVVHQIIHVVIAMWCRELLHILQLLVQYSYYVCM